MDNASKALIMAGAILIAVMLISLAVLLFNQGQQIAQTSANGLSQYTINTHNRQFEKYFTGSGDSVTGAVVNSLCGELRSYNSQNELIGTYGKIDPGPSGTTNTFDKTYSNSSRYTITGDYYEAGNQFAGCLKEITIKTTNP